MTPPPVLLEGFLDYALAPMAARIDGSDIDRIKAHILRNWKYRAPAGLAVIVDASDHECATFIPVDLPDMSAESAGDIGDETFKRIMALTKAAAEEGADEDEIYREAADQMGEQNRLACEFVQDNPRSELVDLKLAEVLATHLVAMQSLSEYQAYRDAGLPLLFIAILFGSGIPYLALVPSTPSQLH